MGSRGSGGGHHTLTHHSKDGMCYRNTAPQLGIILNIVDQQRGVVQHLGRFFNNIQLSEGVRWGGGGGGEEGKERKREAVIKLQ